jgi:hypothetical protein
MFVTSVTELLQIRKASRQQQTELFPSYMLYENMDSPVPSVHENGLLRMCYHVVIKLYHMRAFAIRGSPATFILHYRRRWCNEATPVLGGSVCRYVLPQLCTTKQHGPIMHDMIATGPRDVQWDKKTPAKISRHPWRERFDPLPLLPNSSVFHCIKGKRWHSKGEPSLPRLTSLR